VVWLSTERVLLRIIGADPALAETQKRPPRKKWEEPASPNRTNGLAGAAARRSRSCVSRVIVARTTLMTRGANVAR
jgi:hypothetical protein